MSNQKYAAPKLDLNGFNCPHCGAYSHQTWHQGAYVSDRGTSVEPRYKLSYCVRCKEFGIWVGAALVWPTASSGELAHEDMPPDVKEDFEEARGIVGKSPRGAAALLRLCIQKLMPHLHEDGANLDQAIASLVRKGLPQKIQQSLDSVRVVGNNSVHPGKMDMRDNVEIAHALFGLVNVVVDAMISQLKRAEEIYGKLPPSAREHIEERDSKS